MKLEPNILCNLQYWSQSATSRPMQDEKSLLCVAVRTEEICQKYNCVLWPSEFFAQ